VNEQGVLVLDPAIVIALKELRGKRFYEKIGVKKLTVYLKRDYHFKVNHKKLARLCKQHMLLVKREKKTKRSGKMRCHNRTITGPNQLWQFDIKYGSTLADGRFFFLMAFIDVYTKEVIDYHIGKSCKSTDILFVLEMALKSRGLEGNQDLYIRSDNGTQMTSNKFKHFVKVNSINHEFTAPACPNQNAFIESFFSIVQRELFDVSIFWDFREAYGELVDFIKHYNEERIHGSLKMLTPIEFRKNWTNIHKIREKRITI